MNVMRLGGGVTMVLLGGFLAVMWARERGRKKHRERDESESIATTRNDKPGTAMLS
jgi:hypothetical protein